MELRAPKYYKKFKCIAHRCTHSCCVGWEICIDGDTLERYQALPGEMGERIRQSIDLTDGGAQFRLGAAERCPHLDGKGLCRIITALGEGYLCDICREHPRFYNAVGDHLECGLGAACEEAARLILAEADYRALVTVGQAPDTSTAKTEGFDAVAERDALLCLLSAREVNYSARREEIAARCGLCADPDPAWERRLLDSLEYMDERHRVLFCESCAHADPPTGQAATFCERFLAYLIYRHTGSAATPTNFCGAVGLALMLERLFGRLIGRGMDPVRAAVAVSEELEYSEDNTAAIVAAVIQDR